MNEYYQNIYKHNDSYEDEKDYLRGIHTKLYSTLEAAKKNCPWWHEEYLDISYSDAVKTLLIQISFTEQFKSFIYNEETHTYSYDGTILGKVIADIDEDGNMIYDDINCVNPSIQFKDGRIISLTTEYGNNYKVTYFDIGTTKVTVPQEVIENAVEVEK